METNDPAGPLHNSVQLLFLVALTATKPGREWTSEGAFTGAPLEHDEMSRGKICLLQFLEGVKTLLCFLNDCCGVLEVRSSARWTRNFTSLILSNRHIDVQQWMEFSSNPPEIDQHLRCFFPGWGRGYRICTTLWTAPPPFSMPTCHCCCSALLWTLRYESRGLWKVCVKTSVQQPCDRESTVQLWMEHAWPLSAPAFPHCWELNHYTILPGCSFGTRVCAVVMLGFRSLLHHGVTWLLIKHD